MASTVTIVVNGHNNTGPMFSYLNRSVNNFTNNTTHQFNQMNQTINNSVSGIGGYFTLMFRRLPGVVQAGLVTAAAAIAGTFAAAIGASLNALLLTVIGGGLIAGAIVAAAGSSQVSGAFSRLGQEIATDFRAASQEFVQPLVNSAKVFRDAWRDAINPYLKGWLQDLAPVVERLALGFAGLVTNAMPGFNRALDAAKPVLEKFAQLLPELGSALGDFFDSLAEGGDGAIKGMVFLMALLGGTLKALGNTIEFLSKSFDALTSASERVNTALSKIPILGKLFEPMAERMRKFNETAEAGNGVLARLGGNFISTAGAALEAGQAAAVLSMQMDELFNTMTSVTDKNIAYEQAVDDLTESFKENGRSIDITTQAGRDNVSALEEVARAAYEARNAAIQMAGGENASAAAVDAANAKFAAQIGILRNQLAALGLTKAQIDALLSSWYALANAPNVSKTVSVTYRTYGDAKAALGSGNVVGNGRTVIGYPTGGVASGGSTGLVRTSEQGPELIDWRGGRIYNAAQARRMASQGAGGGGGSPVQVNIVVSPGVGFGGDPLVSSLLSAINNGRLKLTVSGNRVVAA